MAVALVVVIVLVIAVGLAMLGGSLVIATAGAMFFHQGFWDGFHVAWDQPGYLALFSLILLPLFGNLRLTSDSK